MKQYNYIIVGQGIAGTLLAYFLLKAGKDVVIIDEQHKGAASKVAAGIINPVTGRRIVKSWRIDDLLPFAEATYRQIEQEFDLNIYHQKNILRSFDNNKQFTDWSVKSVREDMCDYISDECETEHLQGIIRPHYAWGEIHDTARVDLPLLIDIFRNFFIQKNILFTDNFNYEKIIIEDHHIIYNDLKSPKIIFCEGWRSRFNPYFNDLPHEAAKGESLIIRIPDVALNQMIKSGIFIVPTVDDRYWVGSTYAWDDLNDTPTEAARTDLLQRLDKVLEVPYEVLEHHAAVRPVFKHRRPVMGWHKTFSQLGIFNGLGTKGASIAPYWAAHFCEHLCTGTPLDAEVDVGNVW